MSFDLSTRQGRSAASSARWRARNPDKVKAAAKARVARRRVDPEARARHNASYQRWRAKTRAVVDHIKTERGCIDCGYNSHPEALDFDHRDPKAKSFNIGQLNASRAAVLAEIEKCDVRCANCHRVKTATDRKERTSA